MKKPRNIVYGVDDIPPRGVLLLSGLQHVGLVAIFLLVPVIACRQAGMPAEKIIDVLSLSMLVMAAGPILHALRLGPVGSGYLCPPIFAAAYLPASLLALQAGGLPLMFGMTLFAGVRVFTSSALVVGTLAALLLNLVFRIGVRRTQTLEVSPSGAGAQQIDDFMQTHGAAWGARRDVIERARFNLMQSIELLTDSGVTQGMLTVVASFDEFRLDVSVSYDGAPLELPERRPSNEEIIASTEGHYRLAGYMLRNLADRVQVNNRGGRTTVAFHFDH